MIGKGSEEKAVDPKGILDEMRNKYEAAAAKHPVGEYDVYPATQARVPDFDREVFVTIFVKSEDAKSLGRVKFSKLEKSDDEFIELRTEDGESVGKIFLYEQDITVNGVTRTFTLTPNMQLVHVLEGADVNKLKKEEYFEMRVLPPNPVGDKGTYVVNGLADHVGGDSWSSVRCDDPECTQEHWAIPVHALVPVAEDAE